MQNIASKNICNFIILTVGTFQNEFKLTAKTKNKLY